MIWICVVDIVVLAISQFALTCCDEQSPHTHCVLPPLPPTPHPRCTSLTSLNLTNIDVDWIVGEDGEFGGQAALCDLPALCPLVGLVSLKINLNMWPTAQGLEELVGGGGQWMGGGWMCALCV